MSSEISTAERAAINAAIEAGKVRKVETGASAFSQQYVWDGRQLVSIDDSHTWANQSKRKFSTLRPASKRIGDANRSDVKRAADKGLTVTEICAETKLCEASVRLHLKTLGITPSRKEIVAEYVVIAPKVAELKAAGLSDQTIAAQLGVHKNTVWRAKAVAA